MFTYTNEKIGFRRIAISLDSIFIKHIRVLPCVSVEKVQKTAHRALPTGGRIPGGFDCGLLLGVLNGFAQYAGIPSLAEDGFPSLGTIGSITEGDTPGV